VVTMDGQCSRQVSKEWTVTSATSGRFDYRHDIASVARQSSTSPVLGILRAQMVATALCDSCTSRWFSWIDKDTTGQSQWQHDEELTGVESTCDGGQTSRPC
jgi:hypothetical protein